MEYAECGGSADAEEGMPSAPCGAVDRECILLASAFARLECSCGALGLLGYASPLDVLMQTHATGRIVDTLRAISSRLRVSTRMLAYLRVARLAQHAICSVEVLTPSSVVSTSGLTYRHA